MLTNGLVNALYLGVNREKVVSVLEKMGKDAQIRGEKLTPDEFATLANELYELR